jgi:ABC-2 type transport system ATP-binding protein/lipopolysaccharide transport system ATP-binding protein
VVSIKLANASVELPIYNAAGRSLRNTIFRRVGGAVGSNDSDVVTVRALSDVTVSVSPGDRLAIMGHNGSGKSTILRVFAGAFEPSSGLAEISGTVSSLLDITMGMDPELTGAENVVLRGVFVGLSIKEARERIPEIEEFSELGGFMNLPLRTYSSGMVLRLAFAVSTVRHSDILLLDELISVGDRSFAARARERIDAMIDNASILALASHDFGTMKQYCNRAILLQSGSLVADGPVDAVIERYQHLVAGT